MSRKHVNEMQQPSGPYNLTHAFYTNDDKKKVVAIIWKKNRKINEQIKQTQ